MVISRCCFAEAGKDFFISIASIARFKPIKFLIYDVLIAVPVVDAKAPLFFWFCFCSHLFAEEETDLFISTFRTCSKIIFPHLTNEIIVCGIVFAVLFVLA